MYISFQEYNLFVNDNVELYLLCNVSGVKLSDASKKLGKKFATGASVVKVRQYEFIKSRSYLTSIQSRKYFTIMFFSYYLVT